MKKKNIVVIGAGPAGLTFAYYLLKKNNDYNVIIIEKDDLVGGISKTVNFNGYKVDTGIHRFFSKNDMVNNIWKEILPIQNKPAYDDVLLEKKREYENNGSNPELEDKSMLIKDRLTRIYYGKKFYDYPVSINMTLIKNMGFLNILKAGFSYIKSCLFKRKELSLEDFYINRFGKVLYNMFFENYTEKVWGVHPSKISADWGAQRVKGISITAVIKDFINKKLGKKDKNNTETSLIERFLYPKLGSGQMWSEMADKIINMGGTIKLKCNLVKVNIKNNRVYSIEYKENGKTYCLEIDYCVSSMPIKDLFLSLGGIKVDEGIYKASVNLPYREFMSVCMVVDKIILQNNTKVKTLNNIIPDSWIYIQEPEVRMGRLQIFNNWSPYLFKNKEDIKNKVLIGIEYFCSEDDKYWNMSDNDFINFAIEEAIKINLIENKNNVKEAIRIKIPKAYPAYFGSYANIKDIIEYLNEYENLYCIGRNGQHRYNNMDHSMLTGIKAAESIISGVGKEEVWKVNEEQEYHEIKKGNV